MTDPRPGLSGPFILRLGAFDPDTETAVGRKAANLDRLVRLGIPVPDGVVVTERAYLKAIDESGVSSHIRDCIEVFEEGGRLELEACAAEVRKLVLGAALDASVSQELAGILEDIDPEALWAVRSSAVAEDMPKASFAGQQDSYMCVRTRDVPARIRDCWASYWSDRAVRYRSDAGIDHLARGIAVIVQKMVDARVSGVLFTADPVRGAKDRIVIESSWGLGEAIVSGIVVPDRFEVSHRSLEVVDQVVSRKDKGVFMTPSGPARKPVDRESVEAPSLTHSEAHELAQMCVRIEQMLGAPQDIEWAISGGDIQILQSRPITTLVSKEQLLWTRGYGDEYWADVTSPLFFSLLGSYLTDYVNHEGARILGYKELVDAPLLRVHKGHIYFNAAVLEQVFAYNPKFSRTKELLNYFPAKDQHRIATARTRIVPRLWSEVRVALMDPDGMIVRTDKAYREWSRTFMKEAKRFDGVDLEQLSNDRLQEEFVRFEKALLKHYRLIRYGMVSHSIGMNLILKRWLHDWLGDKDGALYSRLVSGLPGNRTIETNIALEALAKAAKVDPSVAGPLSSMPSQRFLELMATDEKMSAYRVEFQRFLKDYGHRSHTREMFFPRWSEAPTQVVDILKALVGSERLDLDEHEKLREQERLRAERDVLDRVSRLKMGWLKKTAIKQVMKFAQIYLIFRENQRFYLDHQIIRWRRLFLEYGRRFAGRGMIRDPEDVFFLSVDEVFRMAKVDLPNVKEIIAARRKEFDLHRDLLPPKFLKGALEFDDTVVVDASSMRIQGTGSSPGVATGRVRVLTSIERLNEVRQDDILVTTNTDPGWTPIFSKLKGLVTETGGILSHGAVVSREYNIPAVTAVMNATQLLVSGQTVTIDGGEGLILINVESTRQDTDVIHPFGDHPDWNESFYFNFYDRKNGICGAMRIGLKPNRDEKSSFLFLMLPDGSNLGARVSETRGDDSLSVGGLRFEKVSPERTWDLEYDGTMAEYGEERPGKMKVVLKARFDGLHRLFDYRDCVYGEKEQVARMAAAEHTEQYGSVTGTLDVGSERYELDALGERDHSWGVRDWIAPTMWIWLSCQFSKDAAFNLTKLIMPEGVVDAGFLNINGRTLPIVKAEIETVYGPDGGPLSLEILLHDKIGGTHEISAEVMRKVMLPFEGQGGSGKAIMHETLARYSYGNDTGYGIAEYLKRNR